MSFPKAPVILSQQPAITNPTALMRTETTTNNRNQQAPRNYPCYDDRNEPNFLIFSPVNQVLLLKQPTICELVYCHNLQLSQQIWHRFPDQILNIYHFVGCGEDYIFFLRLRALLLIMGTWDTFGRSVVR